MSELYHCECEQLNVAIGYCCHQAFYVCMQWLPIAGTVSTPVHTQIMVVKCCIHVIQQTGHALATRSLFEFNNIVCAIQSALCVFSHNGQLLCDQCCWSVWPALPTTHTNQPHILHSRLRTCCCKCCGSTWGAGPSILKVRLCQTGL